MLRQIFKNSRAVLAAGALVAICLLVAAAFAISLNPLGGHGQPGEDSNIEPDQQQADNSSPVRPNADSEHTEPWMEYDSDSEQHISPTQTAAVASQQNTPALAAANPLPLFPESDRETPDPTASRKPPLLPSPSAPSDSPDPDNPVVTLPGLSGHVRHVVWDTPLPGVTVRLSSGASAVTDSLGAYEFSNLNPGDVVATTVSGHWRSYEQLSRVIVVEAMDVTNVDFTVYAENEALGREWQSAAEWRNESSFALTPLVTRVSAASNQFAGLTTDSARAMLGAARNGSQPERASGELLASWLSLAAGELGFDTPVDVSSTPGGVTALGTDPGSALALVRQGDHVIAEESNPDWSRLRRVLSQRSLVD